jgi:L-ribulose-5-phosphate 4-epimerase
VTPESVLLTAKLAPLRQQLVDLHGVLDRSGLVAWTSGNISTRVPGEDLMIIKASGVPYQDLNSQAMVVTDLKGEVLAGSLRPSSDTATHAYIYRHMPDVGGVVHTHSSFATAWAARGEAIPCVLTMIADEFGGDVPCGPFAPIGDESIGAGIVETLNNSRARAVLMKSHGPFVVGPTPAAALKTAVLLEEIAKTVHLARQLGVVERIDQGAIDSLHQRYQCEYGQRS